MATTDVIKIDTAASRAPRSDLEKAYDALQLKRQLYDRYYSYYDGDAPTPYASARLRKVFEGLDVDIQENWSSVVINAAAERINLEDIEVEGGNSKDLKDLVDETELLLEADEAVNSALVTGEGFLFVWKDEEDQEIEVYNHDPRMCHVFYDPNKPRNKSFGCKWWFDEATMKIHLNLYYADHIEYYTTNENCLKDTGEVDLKSWQDFERDPDREEDAPNPYDLVPIFHFRTGRRAAVSLLKDVIPLQDAINMAVINMAVNGEYSSAPQKYIITNGEINGRLRNSPEMIWELPAGDGAGQGTSVGQFTATDMKNFTTQIEHYVNALAVITRTPKHYFDASGAPSGESLIIQEAPLIKKCQDIIARFKVEYRALGAFLLLLDGKRVEKSKIRPKFADPQSVQPLTQESVNEKKAGNVETKQRVGISRKQALTELGYDEDQIKEMELDKQNEADQATEQMLKQQEAGAGAFGIPGGPKPGEVDENGDPVKPLAGAAAVASAVAGKVKPSAI